MKVYDAGHKETQTALPDPLASTGLWSLGTLALPAALLSWASASVFFVVWGFFELDTKRQELFRLPFPYAGLIAAGAAGLAWLIVVICRKRPGRRWPRIWALALAALSTTLVVLGLIVPDSPRVLALAVASLASAATLTPRLVKVRPNSQLVQHVAPMSMLMILLVILPSSCAVRSALAGKAEHRVDQHIRQLGIWTSEINEIKKFGWSRMEDSPDDAAKRVDELRQLKFQGATGDAELWRDATILGKDVELASALQTLTESVVAGLKPEQVPKVSDLKEAAIRWDHQQKRWEPYTQFPRLSEITGGYHQEMGRLFGELGVYDPSAGYAKLVDYREHYAAQREVLQSQLNAAAGTWADNWAPFRAYDEMREPSIRDVLRTPFVSTYTPGDLWTLTALPLYRVRQLACEPNRARGCKCQEYPDDGFNYFRLDCYSYAPAEKGTGADLRLEMRLVYESAKGQPLDEQKRPAEIFFHFLIPEGYGIDNFREEVMTDLASAVRESLKNGAVRNLVRSADRSGSVAGGFNIVAEGTSVRVYRPKVVPLKGLEPELRALEVRVERAAERKLQPVKRSYRRTWR